MTTVTEYLDLAQRRLSDYVDRLSIFEVYVDMVNDKYWVVLNKKGDVSTEAAIIWRALDHTVGVVNKRQRHRVPRGLYISYHHGRWVT